MLCIRANSSLSRFARRWRGGCFLFWPSGLRSARGRGRAGFFFEQVRALVARGMFSLLVKRLALRAGQSAGLVFSLSWFSRWWRGGCFSFGQMACAPRGSERSFIKADCSLLMSKENQKTTSDFDALDPRERGCSPLSDPKEEVEPEKS